MQHIYNYSTLSKVIALAAILSLPVLSFAQDGMRVGSTAAPNEMLHVDGAILLGTTSNTNLGTIRWNNTLDRFEGYTSSGWVSLSTAGADNLGNHSATQLLDMNSFKITELATPTAATDAATKAYVDAHTDADADASNEIQALSIAGSTITLNNGGGSVTVPSTADNLGNHSATQLLDMNSFKITELATPTAATDAATKAYVDAHTDADADASNEIQDLSIAADVLTLSGDATTVSLVP